jgi:hypothetical protein
VTPAATKCRATNKKTHLAKANHLRLIQHGRGGFGGTLMSYAYHGVEFGLDIGARPENWHWRYAIGGDCRTGSIEAKLELLAIRQVWSVIDLELRQRARDQRATVVHS